MRRTAIGYSAIHRAPAGDQAAKTFAHECAHHVALTRATETIAQGAAFATLARCGLDAGDYPFPYVAARAADRAVMARNLAAILDTAALRWRHDTAGRRGGAAPPRRASDRTARR